MTFAEYRSGANQAAVIGEPHNDADGRGDVTSMAQALALAAIAYIPAGDIVVVDERALPPGFTGKGPKLPGQSANRLRNGLADSQRKELRRLAWNLEKIAAAKARRIAKGEHPQHPTMQ